MEVLARVPGMMLGRRRGDGHAADGIGDGAGVGTVLSGAAAGMGGMGIVCMGMVSHGFPPMPADLGLDIMSRSRACFHNCNTRGAAGALAVSRLDAKAARRHRRRPAGEG